MIPFRLRRKIQFRPLIWTLLLGTSSAACSGRPSSHLERAASPYLRGSRQTESGLQFDPQRASYWLHRATPQIRRALLVEWAELPIEELRTHQSEIEAWWDHSWTYHPEAALITTSLPRVEAQGVDVPSAWVGKVMSGYALSSSQQFVAQWTSRIALGGLMFGPMEMTPEGLGRLLNEPAFRHIQRFEVKTAEHFPLPGRDLAGQGQTLRPVDGTLFLRYLGETRTGNRWCTDGLDLEISEEVLLKWGAQSNPPRPLAMIETLRIRADNALQPELWSAQFPSLETVELDTHPGDLAVLTPLAPYIEQLQVRTRRNARIQLAPYTRFATP